MSRYRVLIVEPEPAGSAALVSHLTGQGYEAVPAADGGEAWQRLEAEAERFDAVLLDRRLPDMDGIDILRRVKSRPAIAHLPVIMQTAMSEDTNVVEGLRAGAYYYLAKPFSTATLLAIVSAAVRDSRNHRELLLEARRVGHSLACLATARFVFRNPEEVRNIAALMANVVPDPERVVLGLSELMLNAIEHGNLAIGYDEKTRLIDEGRLSQEIARRLAAPEQQGRFCELLVQRDASEVSFTIRDQGAGFDWKNYLDMSAERVFDAHGRGIALSRMLSFDRLEYRGRGNEVLAVLRVQTKEG